MPDNLMRTKIKEALLSTGHDRHNAQKLLVSWAVRDHALLLAMTKPHLRAISAGLIDHALRHQTDASVETNSDGLSRETIDDIVASSATVRLSGGRKGANLPPPKSTERQASTMRKLAAAFTRKKKD